MFDEYKIKKLLESNIDVDTFIQLKPKIKNDERIIRHFIECNPEKIGIVGTAKEIQDYLKEKPELIKFLPDEEVSEAFWYVDNKTIDVDKGLFDRLTVGCKKELFKQDPEKYIFFFDEEDRYRILVNVVLNMGEFNGVSFDDELVKKVILSLDSKRYLSLLDIEQIKHVIIDILLNLSFDKAYELCQKHPELLEEFPQESQDEIRIKEAGNDISKLQNLSYSAKKKIALKDHRFILCFNIDDKLNFVENAKSLSIEDMPFFVNEYIRSDITCMDEETAFKVLACNFIRIIDYKSYKNGGKGYTEVHNFIINRLRKLYGEDKSPEIIKLYKSLSEDVYINKEKFIYYNEIFQISKILLDPKLINNNDFEDIKKYKETRDRQLLIKILSNGYGKHVEEIFAERPNLDLEHLESFIIFDSKIYNVLGKGFINFALTYNLASGVYLIYEMAEDENTLRDFKNFWDFISSDYDNINVNFICNIMEKFAIYKNILKDVDYSSLDEVTKANIKAMIFDMHYTALFINTFEDIRNYKDIRKKVYADYAKGIKKSKDLINLIFSFVADTELVLDNETATIGTLGLESFYKVFSIDYIMEKSELIEKIGLDKNDIAILLMLNKIRGERDVEVLRDALISIIDNDLDYTRIYKIADKVKIFCEKSIKENILSKEKLETLPKNELDGVEVVELNSETFSTLVSVMGLNLSTRGYTGKKVYGLELLRDWLYREGGSSTISTSFVSSDTSIYPTFQDVYSQMSDFIAFVFDDKVDIQGMGASDISTSHEKKDIHRFSYVGTTKIGYLPVEDFKNSIIESMNGPQDFFNKGKFQSEVSISRYHEDIRKPDSSKRVMPIGIYVVGDITDEMLETAKVFNEFYEKHKLGKFRIIKVNPTAYRSIVGNTNSRSDKNEHTR